MIVRVSSFENNFKNESFYEISKSVKFNIMQKIQEKPI